MFDQIKVGLVSSWGTDRNAAEAAWASSYDKAKAEARSDEDVARVVKGIVNLHHDTPKERVWFEFFITCPIFVERQYDKYRMTVQMQDIRVEFLQATFGREGITQNELSGRYRTIPDRPYTMPRDVLDIVSMAENTTHPDKARDLSQIKESLDSEIERQHSYYSSMVDMLRAAETAGSLTNAEFKRAREVLRGVLGTAYLTDMRIVMNANAFEHIVNQRLAREAQMESRIVAYLMLQEAKNVAPIMVREMIKSHGWEVLSKEVEDAILADDDK